MTEQKNERVQCMIERYQKEISGETDWYFRGAIRRIDKDLIRRYCFPALFSALFYDPTPEQLRYIAGEAERMAFNFSVFIEKDAKRNKLLRVQNMMKLAAYEVGKPDFQYWRETLRKDSGFYRALLICGSVHPNGYLREQCLLHFPETDMWRLLEFAYPCLADPVPAVRRAAWSVIAERMQRPDAATPFIDAMPYAELARQSERAHRNADFSIDALDHMLIRFFEKDPQRVLQRASGLCYKVFAQHPDPQYRGLILHFYRREHSGELRCLLMRIYIRMTDVPLPANVLEMFMQDHYAKARLIAYEYKFAQEGIRDGFEQLLLSPSRRIRDYAANKLKACGFDFLTYAREHLPESLPLLGNYGTEADIPLVRQYLETHPAQAMYALAKLGAPDIKTIILNKMLGDNKRPAKTAYRLARSLKCFDTDELLPLIRDNPDSVQRYRLTLLLTKNGVWSAMPHLIRALKDDLKNYQNFLYIIQKYIGLKAYVTEDQKKEIIAALAYVRDGNYLPSQVNNQIIYDMSIRY